MPEQLKVHPGERVDLTDYVHGANTYTEESQKFLLEREILDRRSRVLDGFRVKIEDQTANPGMITIYNGNALDRDGQLINNEQSVNDSRSITLLGANLNFYVEIEFILNESSTDARFLWDPTIPNTAPEPDGSEFGLNVATRLTPDWRIVSPVSTTSFEQTSNPNSIRVPVGVFRTDGSNRVVTGGTNPGLVLVRAASVLETDVSSGVSSFRVVDARMLPATTPFNITLDVGGSSPEPLTVSGVDRDNGIVTVSAPLGFNHVAGAIVQVTSGTADLVRENIDPSDPALNPLLATPGHPDPAQRLWQANEVRGSGLIQSKETFGARDDLNIRALKDYIDYLSAQVRELKFGSPRPEVVSTAPPASFATRPRWFDRVGSVAGARSNSVSIGNGTTTFGDFNGTDGSALVTAAVAALPASGGTIYVKAGTYTFASTVSIAKPVVFVGEHYAASIFSNTNAGGAALSTTANLRFENMSLQVGGGGAVNVIDATGAVYVDFNYCTFTGQLRAVNVNVGIIATSSTFTGSAGQPIVLGSTVSATLTDASFDHCAISTVGSVFACAVNGVRIQDCNIVASTVLAPLAGACNVSEFYAQDSTFTVAFAVVIANTNSGAVDGCVFDNCQITSVLLGSGQGIFYFANTGTIDRVSVKNSYINITGGVTSAVSPGYVLFVENNTSSTDLQFEGNHVDAFVGSFIVPVNIDQDTLAGRCAVADNYLFRTLSAVRLGGTVGSMDTGELTISGNVHDNDSEHATVYGVILRNNGRLDRLNILNNTFVNYDSADLGARHGVDLSTTDSSSLGMLATVAGNKFVNLADPAGSSSSAFGVVYDVSTVASMTHTWDIRDNLFYEISGDAGCAGILLRCSSASAMRASIRNNQIYNIGITGTSADACGIRCENLGPNGLGSAVTVADNFIYNVVSSAGANIGSGIELAACSAANVTGNYVAAIRALLTSGTPALQSGCGIRVAGSTNNVIIADNIVDQSLSSVPAEATMCIALRSTGTLTGFSVARNVLRSSTTTEAGGGMIWLVVSVGSEAFVNGTVAHNVLVWRATSASGDALHVDLGGPSKAIDVVNNIVENTTYSANVINYRGIDVRGFNTGGTPRAVKVSGNILHGPKSGALLTSATRIGIRLRGALTKTVVTDNLIDWNEPGVLEGIGIKYSNSGLGAFSGHLCNSNFVRGDNSATAGGEVDIDTAAFTDGLLDSNQLGEPAAVGTIVPGAAAGGWTYGTNKLT